MRLSDEARRQVDALRTHYRRKQRPEAIRNLRIALRAVPTLVAQGKSLPAPRPYPGLAIEGQAWVHVPPYWIAYALLRPPQIVTVFHNQANIPARL